MSTVLTAYFLGMTVFAPVWGALAILTSYPTAFLAGSLLALAAAGFAGLALTESRATTGRAVPTD